MKHFTLVLVIFSYFCWLPMSAEEISPAWEKANNLLQINEKDAAIKVLSEGIVKEPKNAELYSLRGSLLAEKGKFKAALKDQNKAIEYASDKFLLGGSYLNKALVEIVLNIPKDAERDFKKALEIEPKLSVGYWEYGKFLLRQKRAAEAIPNLEKAKNLLTGAAPEKDIRAVEKLLQEAKAQ